MPGTGRGEVYHIWAVSYPSALLFQSTGQECVISPHLTPDCICWRCLGIFPYTQLLPPSDLKPAHYLDVSFIKMALWPLCFVLFFLLTLFTFFYRPSNLQTRLSRFASVDCSDSKKPVSSGRREQQHCLLSVDFVTQRLPRDKLQTDSYEAQRSPNLCFLKKKK